MGMPLPDPLSEVTRAYLLKDLARLSSSREDLTVRIGELKSQIQALEEELSRIVEAIDSFGPLLVVGQGVSGELLGEPAVNARVAPKPADSLAEHILNALRDAEKPQHYRLLTKAIIEHGVSIGGRDPAATILSILLNKRYQHRFVRVGRGVYGLSEQAGVRVLSGLKSSRRRKRRK